jgi:signal peptidase I
VRARLLRVAALLLGAAAIALALLGATSRLYRIAAPAMEPTLRPGDRILVPRWWYRVAGPGRGDIVAFRTSASARRRCGTGGVYVQRVVGLPGERWSERRGAVLIDGRPLEEPYVRRRDTMSHPGGRLGRRKYLLLGDNRSQTCDSRVFGPVDRDALLGRVLAVYWPPTRVNLR